MRSRRSERDLGRLPSRWHRLVAFALVLQSCSSSTAWGRRDEPEERLIGWKGDTFDPEQVFDPLKLSAKDGDAASASSRSWVETISWKPRAFIYHNFITPLEARHMIEQAAVSMKRSTVVGAGGKSVEDSYRTSYGTFLRRLQDPVIARIENRVAAWTQIPVSHQEDTQILRYGIGQFYKVHSDTLEDDGAGLRVATMLIYLNESDEGGETAFPISEWLDDKLEETYGANFSECAKGHVAFKPRKGSALLFWSINPDGKHFDQHASHTGCPVIKGVKWTATKWLHAKPFRPAELEGDVAARNRQLMQNSDPGVCEDTSSTCATWAKDGMCDSNREFMVAGPVNIGRCRKACKECEVCAPDDKVCYNANRVRIGYLHYNSSELN